VYFFAYEETIQEDALHLVAAKVAAALRVNGDTVGDDSLADLDDLTSGDLVATLAKIITGDVQIEARSLQQAFAEANVSLRQANTIIGEYSMVDEEMDEQVAVVVNGNGQRHGERQQPATSAGSVQALSGDQSRKSKEPLRIPEQIAGTNGHPIRQPTLFTNGVPKANGKPAQPHLNGQTKGDDKPTKLDIPVHTEPSVPPAPRPRLFRLPSSSG